MRSIARLTAVIAALIMVVSTLAVLNVAGVGDSARIWTDKLDYKPGDQVHIYGENFWGSTITVSVERPDLHVDSNIDDPTLLYSVWIDAGGFEFIYQLDGIRGNYTVTAWDDLGATATTTFTDAAGWEQAMNDDDNNDVPDVNWLHWINGNLGGTKAVVGEGNYPPPYPPYFPGQVDYRATFENLMPGQYS